MSRSGRPLLDLTNPDVGGRVPRRLEGRLDLTGGALERLDALLDLVRKSFPIGAREGEREAGES